MNLSDKSKAIGITKKTIEAFFDEKKEIVVPEDFHTLAMMIINNLEVNMTSRSGIKVRDHRDN